MKRGQTTILLAVLVVSIFGIGITPTEAAMYQALKAGDQLLYKNVLTFYEDLEQQLYHETDVADSWWVIDHWDYVYDEMESYYINSVNTGIANANYAWTLSDRYNNRYMLDYYYDYIDLAWVLNDSYFDYEPVTLSGFEVRDFDVYNGILNFDATDWFYYGVYDHSEVKYYVINGVNTSHTVDVYIDTYDDEITTAYTYAGINFDETNPYGWKDEFYVDSETGFLLEYTTMYYDNYYRTIDHRNSPTLGCFVDYYFNHTYGYYYEWQLYETTAAFSPVADADLPVLLLNMGYDYDITGDTPYLTFYFDLMNKWPSLTIEVLLDGTLVETLIGMLPGSSYYTLDTSGIQISENNHTVTFIVYDDANNEHFTIWSIEIQDIRLDWPVISGPYGEYWYTLGDTDVLQWELTDYYGNGYYFELRIDGVLDNRSDWWSDGTLVTVVLSENITYVGTHSIQITAYDYNYYASDSYLIIYASEAYTDEIPPTITGSTSDFSMDEGEDIKLIWTIYDENPSSYEIKANGSPYYSSAWTENTKDIVIQLKDFTNGIWYFELIVFDAYGNSNSVSITVTINEVVITTPEPTETTTPTNEQTETDSHPATLTLDSTGVIYSIIGLLSFVSLIAIYKKRR